MTTIGHGKLARSIVALGVATCLLSALPVARAQEQSGHSLVDAALIAAARNAVRRAVLDAKSVVSPAFMSPMSARGVFVTIERDGRVIGCRGTLRPRHADLLAETTAAATSAATSDPRYRPLTPGDLSRFLVTVTVVERLEPLDRTSALVLTPADGIALESGTRTGVVLPWEGRDPATRLRWAYKKAGVPDGSPCRLWRVVARRSRE